MKASDEPLSSLHGPPTLGASLRQLRLRHRQERLQRVLSALRERARAAAGLAGDGTVPEPLVAAITGFELELAAVRDEMRASGDDVHDTAPTRTGKWS